MKTRLISIIILVLILAVLLTRNNDSITNTLLSVINPIKQKYKNFTQNIEDKSHSFIFQKESIEKLGQENRVLRKRLLEQNHYLNQIKNIYTVLPELSKLPIHNISISETISYIKLNSFSQIILTKPKGLSTGKLYGLIQGKVVAGTAKVHNNQLYGYLTSDDKCRFSVFIGSQYAPGIATGASTNEMTIKFIPKWHKIKKGDKVITSGLDNIFFADIPVGVVSKVEIQSSYKVAHINTYSDIYHPKTFFLINDATATITEGFDSNKTRLNPFRVIKTINTEHNKSISPTIVIPKIEKSISVENTHTLSSIPSHIDQTQENIVEPMPLIEEEIVEVTIPKKIKYIKKKKKRYKLKKKPNKKKTSLDLF